jgi:histidinol phosphatase-like enzyme
MVLSFHESCRKRKYKSTFKMNIIFLDIDGVLNCQTFYTERTKKQLKKGVKKGAIDKKEYYSNQLCKERISWLNELCKEVDAKVVISSTWRHNENVVTILKDNGATFDIIGITPDLREDYCMRGNEIYQWIYRNSERVNGVPSYNFKTYVIIDDDSDMLLWQRDHFFQTDTYSGLTPNTCHRIKRFFLSVKNIEDSKILS